MKKCGYCGQENEDAQGVCRQCGTPFEAVGLTGEQKASVPIGIGCIVLFIARHVMLNSDAQAPSWFLGVSVGLVGIGTVVWGCRCLAIAKGYPPWLGWLGLLSCLGPIVLYLIPKRPPKAGLAQELDREGIKPGTL